MSPLFHRQLRRHLLGALAATSLSVLPHLAKAQAIIGAIGVTASAPMPGGFFLPPALIDQSGLSAHYVNGVTDFDLFTSTTTPCFSCTPGDPFSEVGGVGSLDGDMGTLTFDLGSSVAIDAIAIWWHSGVGTLRTFDLHTGGGTLIGSFTMPDNSNLVPQPAAVFRFNSVTTQLVALHVTSNFGYPEGTILNEVAFQASAVPEPDSDALALSGLAIVGLAARRSARCKSASRS